MLLAASAALACRPAAEQHRTDPTVSASGQGVQLDTARAGIPARTPPSAERDRSSLEIGVDDADLLVVDPASRETGKRLSTGEKIVQIPQSRHFVDAIDDDVTGEVATSKTSSVGISQPPEGTYRIQLRGLPAGAQELSIHAFSSDGRPQPVQRIPLNLGAGQVATFNVRFSRSGPVDFMRITSGTVSGIDTQVREVLRTEAEWRTFWTELNGVIVPRPERRQVDFTRDVVVVVAMGRRPTTGYAINVDEIRVTGSVLTVALTEVSPGPTCPVQSTMTRPVDVVRTPLADVPQAQFTVSQQTTTCP